MEMKTAHILTDAMLMLRQSGAIEPCLVRIRWPNGQNDCFAFIKCLIESPDARVTSGSSLLELKGQERGVIDRPDFKVWAAALVHPRGKLGILLRQVAQF